MDDDDDEEIFCAGPEDAEKDACDRGVSDAEGDSGE